MKNYVSETEWYRFGISTLCRKLETDPEKGIDGEKLSAKKSAGIKNDIFDDGEDDKSGAPKPAWSILSAVLVIMLAVSRIALGDKTSVFSIILTVTGIGLVFILTALSKRLVGWLRDYSVPQVTAIRGGEAVRISQRDIVQGDLLILGEGDMVPCDGRIIDEDGLFVLEKNISGGNGKKDAEYTDDNPGIAPANQLNMVFARSVVSSGSCRVIACDIGAFTLCMRRNMKAKKGKSTSLPLFENVARISRIYSIACSVIVFAITAASFLSGDSSGIYGAFMLSLSVAASSFCEMVCMLAYTGISVGIFPTYDKKNKNNDKALIKNISAIQKMREMTCLFFPKNSGVCENRIEAETVYTNERELEVDRSNADKLKRTVYMAVSTFGGRQNHAKKQTAQTSEQDAFTEMAEDLGIGLDSIESTMIPLEIKHANGDRLFETALVLYKNNYTVCVRGPAVQIVARCASKLSNGSPVPMTEDNRQDLLKRAAEYEENAYRVVAVASKISKYNNLDNIDHASSGLCFEGFVALREPYSESSARAVETLHSLGIKTVMFCDDMTSQSVMLGKRLGICRDGTQKLSAPEFVKTNLNIVDLKMTSYRLFCGFDRDQKKYIVNSFIKKGEKLGVIGRHLYDISLMNDEGTVGFAVNRPQLKGDKKNACVRPENSEALKHAADVIINSADSRGGGGINSVLKAVLTSRRVCNNVYNALVYLIASNAAKFLIASVSAFTGLFTVSVPQILFSGVVVDLLAVISVFLSDNAKMTISTDLFRDAGNKGMAARSFANGALIALCVFISGLAARFAGCAPDACGIVCFAALMLAQFSSAYRICRGKFGIRSGITGFLAISVLIIIEYLALSAVFGGFFDTYLTGSANVGGFFFCLLSPVLYNIVLSVKYYIAKRRERNEK